MKKLHAIAAWIQQETSARRPRLDKTGVVMRTASVLLLLLPGRKGPELLFEVRSSRLGWQPGDICFPGGRLLAEKKTFRLPAAGTGLRTRAQIVTIFLSKKRTRAVSNQPWFFFSQNDHRFEALLFLLQVFRPHDNQLFESRLHVRG